MKKLMQTVTAILVAFAMTAAPVLDAQTRGRGGQSAPNRTSQHSSRPDRGHQQRPSSGSPSRPSGSSSRPSGTPVRPGHGVSGANQNRPIGNGNHYRPGNSGNNGNHNGNRPGFGNNNNRPGQGNDNFRPGHGNNNHRPGHGGNDYRPSTPPPPPAHRPGGGHPGGYRPGHHRPTPPPPPRRHDRYYRHHVPFFGAYHRPVPPPRWHYVSGGPVFGTILGVALGTAIGASLTALANNGYTVSSYGNDVVYLTDVPQMNYYWPDAAMYYNNGMLYGSQFTYATPYYDMSRFNNLYGTFTSQYGTPVEYLTQGGITRATWFGAANRFVTLTFGLNGGSYYTTLSFGN